MRFKSSDLLNFLVKPKEYIYEEDPGIAARKLSHDDVIKIINEQKESARTLI